MISFLGNFYRHLVICFWSRCLEDKWLSICLGWELSNQILLVCIVLRSVWPDYAILKGLGDRFSYKSSSNILSYFEKSAGQLLSKICLLFIPTSGHTSYDITIFKSSCVKLSFSGCPNIWWLFADFDKYHVTNKNCCGYFLSNLWKNLGYF